jgi:lysine 6-dehydrogenase
MKKVIVLGAGLVGKPMMMDLLRDKNLKVSIADRSSELIEAITNEFDVQGVVADLSNDAIVTKTIADHDYVINAVPGFMGMAVLKTILEAGKDVVDIAFSPEDLSPLNEIAVRNNATALVDFGVAPGLSHLMVSYASGIFDRLDKVRIFVGGLPKRRTKPFEYRAVFSPIDVIEEYTRPARLVEHGKTVVKEALTDIEELDFPVVGTLEAFNSDGLRSLVDSIKAEDMAEKTLRYPGHAQLMKTLREIGFFSQDKVNVNGIDIAPMDVTAKLVFPQWEMQEEDRDITIMKVYAEGPIDGIQHRFEFDLFDEFDGTTGVHSMARTTGYTATMGLRVLAAGLFKEKGVFYPEKLGTDKKILEMILEGLKERKIQIQHQLYKI